MIYLNDKKIAVIGIDHGYGNIKTANTVTPTGITRLDAAPIFTGNTLCYDGNYYLIGEGHKEFRRIAIYADSENWCTPCGSCRQFLSEFSPEMEVLCAKAGGRYVSYKLSELMPHTFNF